VPRRGRRQCWPACDHFLWHSRGSGRQRRAPSFPRKHYTDTPRERYRQLKPNDHHERGRILLGESKTKKSRRTIRLTETAVQVLRGRLVSQIEDIERLGASNRMVTSCSPWGSYHHHPNQSVQAAFLRSKDRAPSEAASASSVIGARAHSLGIAGNGAAVCSNYRARTPYHQSRRTALSRSALCRPAYERVVIGG
jgi:hypothetical protein